ncbi:hypothetical protein BDV95DRAFT_549072 [Massariosphaeria phaeospora]|uniref:Uncharacterized protein n=1 Tax=Massariosphaeria phaeospora TaxID=100035 RepID=A0A7C8I5M1_9PLEO|nr:hypothetical protein BDV95DRAFT_549072 [Massariosphaeria phaeospora]
MAEAIAVLGIAANVSRFISYGSQLLTQGYEVYSSLDGASDKLRGLELISNDIKNISEEVLAMTISSKWQQFSEDVQALQTLAEECRTVAKRMLQCLEDLKVPTDSRFRRLMSMLQTLRAGSKAKELEDLQQRLVGLDQRMRYRLNSMFQKQSKSEILSAIQDLDATSKRMEINTVVNLDQWMQEIMDLVSKRTESSANQQIAIENISSRLSALAGTARELDMQRQILQGLVYDQMKHREDMIKKAHQETLQWIFDGADSKFVDWLEQENSIYWVKGKAGSGKSTLIKYISTHSRTRIALQEWASPMKLIVASHFFWNAGPRMEKSQSGLLQNLLYQVLRASPGLILELFGSRSPQEPWSRDELFEALQDISLRSDEHFSAKYCFFIDGLDEYEADGQYQDSEEEIVTLIQGLSRCPNIKICVSSRPGNAFLDAFSSLDYKITMQELTRADMQLYVDQLLARNEKFRQLVQEERESHDLVSRIVEKSQGVWLWITLVVRDMLRDVKGGEQLYMLEQRLKSLPQDLESYFATVLDRIEPRHHRQSARMFLVAMKAVTPIPIMALDLLFRDTVDFRHPTPVVDGHEPLRDLEKSEKLLNSRCRDLLEINRSASEFDIWYPSFRPLKVEFVHSTVKDFLQAHNSQFEEQCGQDFEATISLCHIYLAEMKRMPPVPNHYRLNRSLFSLVDGIMYYCFKIDSHLKYSCVTILNEVEEILATQSPMIIHRAELLRRTRTYIDAYLKEVEGSRSFAIAVSWGLVNYVTETLSHNPNLVREKRRIPYLDYALRPHGVGQIALTKMGSRLLCPDSNPNPEIISILLSHGADPNHERVWADFLRYCHRRSQYSDFSREANFEIIMTLLDAGADPYVQVSKKGHDNLDIIEVFQGVFPGNEWRHARETLIARLQKAKEARENKQTSFIWRMLGWT